MESRTLNNDYELLETIQKDNETWSYLRHKKTGLEIAYHQYETQESGFSFTFRTPAEEQYLGTSHVLEHCVLMGRRSMMLIFENCRVLLYFLQVMRLLMNIVPHIFLIQLMKLKFPR